MNTRSFVLLFLSTLFSPSIAGDMLTPAKPLSDGETLVSAGGNFALGFFTPPGSRYRYVGIWYNKISTQIVVWVANRKTPIANETGILALAANGSLIITSDNSTVIWSTTVASMASPVARLLDTGNFVVQESDGGSVFGWQGFDYPTDTLLPGMKLGWNLTSGLNRNITAWTNASDPAAGPYTITMDIRGDPQKFLLAGSRQTWRGGPWNGLRFSGMPEMETYNMFTFSFVANQEEVYFMFKLVDQNKTARVTLSQSGLDQLLVMQKQSGIWSTFWFAPKDQCDQIFPCGPNGVCNVNDMPNCNCLPGFEPHSPSNWALGNGSGGCVRKTKLDCVNQTDGFMTIGNVKLPDTTSATLDGTMSLDQCWTTCLRNCTCTAYAAANISGNGSGSGSGCIIWTTELTDLRVYTHNGQDLYVRLAAADLAPTSDRSNKGGLPAAAIVLAVVSGTVILALIGYCLRRKKMRRRRAFQDAIPFFSKHNEDVPRGDDLELPLFDFHIVAAATNNFSVDNKLGEGGFGPVYKGVLGEGQEIAVKRLAKTSIQGTDEFKNEVMLIAKLQHRNLVRLLGCCIHREERMLIYEYMPNKSLDVFLFDKANRMILDWPTRLRIISGIARGLLYLHQDSRFRIIHRDLKTSNILLDSGMNPKISDFGIARIFGGDETDLNTRKVAGTYGYMSPEYAMHGIFSVKSDVFSFGVVVLEIISGKRNIEAHRSNSNHNTLGLAWNLWNEGHGLELLDESMGSSFPVTEALRCIKVGLLCVQDRPEDRPTMSSVVLMLGSESASLPNPKQPGFISIGGPHESDSSTSKTDSLTINEITVTMLDGR